MSKAVISINGITDSIRDMGRTWFSWTMGSLLGFFVGILPAAGATPGSLMAYGVAKMASKEPGNFGKGEVAGVVAPESANNAVTGGALIPMMTLGIPGDPATAILIGALLVHGLAPGPLLFIENADFAYTIIFAFFWANIFNFMICIVKHRTE